MQLSDDELTVVLEFCTIQENIRFGSTCTRINRTSCRDLLWQRMVNCDKSTYLLRKKMRRMVQDLELMILHRDGKSRRYRFTLSLFFLSMISWASTWLICVLITGLCLDDIILHGSRWKWIIPLSLFLIASVLHVLSMILYVCARPTGILPDKLTNKLVWYLWNRGGKDHWTFRMFVRFFYNDIPLCMEIRQRVLHRRKKKPFHGSIMFLFLFYGLIQSVWVYPFGVFVALVYQKALVRFLCYALVPVAVYTLITCGLCVFRMFEIGSISDLTFAKQFQIPLGSSQKAKELKLRTKVLAVSMTLWNAGILLTAMLTSLKLAGLMANIRYTHLCIPHFATVIACVVSLSVVVAFGASAELHQEVFHGTQGFTLTFHISLIAAYLVTISFGLVICFIGYALLYAPMTTFVAVVALQADKVIHIRYSLLLIPLIIQALFLILSCVYWIIFNPGSPLVKIIDEDQVSNMPEFIWD